MPRAKASCPECPLGCMNLGVSLHAVGTTGVGDEMMPYLMRAILRPAMQRVLRSCDSMTCL